MRSFEVSALVGMLNCCDLSSMELQLRKDIGIKRSQPKIGPIGVKMRRSEEHGCPHLLQFTW